MSHSEQIIALEKSCKRISEALKYAEICRDDLVALKNDGMSVEEKDKMGDQFPSLIADAEGVVNTYSTLLKHMELKFAQVKSDST